VNPLRLVDVDVEDASFVPDRHLQHVGRADLHGDEVEHARLLGVRDDRARFTVGIPQPIPVRRDGDGRDQVHVEMGTFSKAFGVVGGHVSGSEYLRKFAYNKSRTWLLSGSHPPPVAAACIAAIDILENEPKHVENLWKNRAYFIGAMSDLGFNTGMSETPIIPVMIGESDAAQKFSVRLFEEGVFALPIVYPMVARGTARIRVMMNAALTKDDLNGAITAFDKVGKELNIICYCFILFL